MFRPSRLRIRRLPLAVPIVAALLVLPAAPASADDPVANLDCTFITTQEINPPLTSEFGPVESSTHGLTGTADCTGTIDGAQVTGPGAVGVTSTGFGDCSGVTTSGTFVLQIETTEGTKTVAGRFNASSGPLPGEVIITGDLTGTLDAISVEGDCVNTPITQSTTRWDVHLAT